MTYFKINAKFMFCPKCKAVYVKEYVIGNKGMYRRKCYRCTWCETKLRNKIDH